MEIKIQTHPGFSVEKEQKGTEPLPPNLQENKSENLFCLLYKSVHVYREM